MNGNGIDIGHSSNGASAIATAKGEGREAQRDKEYDKLNLGVSCWVSIGGTVSPTFCSTYSGNATSVVCECNLGGKERVATSIFNRHESV